MIRKLFNRFLEAASISYDKDGSSTKVQAALVHITTDEYDNITEFKVLL